MSGPGRRIASLVALVLLSALAQAQIGSLLKGHRLEVMDSVLADYDWFGQSIARLGDLDGDGVTEIAVSAPHVPQVAPYVSTVAGSVWVLFLSAEGGVRSFTEIGRGVGGFTGTLPDGAAFGMSLTTVGDLDGDGLAELAVSSFEPNPLPGRAAIDTYLWILFLDATGSVRRHTLLLRSDPVFQPPLGPHEFISPIGALGDTDGDGVPDLALGSDDDAGPGADAGAVWILRLNADGTAKSALQIGRDDVAIEADDYFGTSLSLLGDIDRDGNAELAVAATGADGGRGALWILSLRPDQSVLRSVELDRDDFDSSAAKGLEIASVGDLDGDGIAEVVLGLPDYFAGQPPNDIGGLMVAFLASDGSVRKRQIITRNEGGLFPIQQGTGFGRQVEFLGDLDRDGNPEIATGGVYFNDDWGTAWILSLRASAVRNGTGVNAVVLREKSEPAIGATWRAGLDCRGHAPGLALIGFHEAPLPGLPTPAGELLVSGAEIAHLQETHTGTLVRFDVLVPRLVTLVNRPIHAQGLCTGAPGPRLSNALDMLVGR